MKWEKVSKGGRENVQSSLPKIAPNATKLNLLTRVRRIGSWFSPWKPGFEPRVMNVDYFMVKLIVVQFFAEYLCFFLPVTVPLMLHSHLLTCLTCQIGPTNNHVIAFSSLRRSSVGA
jgi:hypothetical protein